MCKTSFSVNVTNVTVHTKCSKVALNRKFLCNTRNSGCRINCSVLCDSFHLKVLASFESSQLSNGMKSALGSDFATRAFKRSISVGIC